jgi:hypothetical protein
MGHDAKQERSARAGDDPQVDAERQKQPRWCFEPVRLTGSARRRILAFIRKVDIGGPFHQRPHLICHCSSPFEFTFVAEPNEHDSAEAAQQMVLEG